MLGIANLHTMDNNGIRIQVETRFFYPLSADFFLNCVPFIIVREVCMWMEGMVGGWCCAQGKYLFICNTVSILFAFKLWFT